MSTPRELRTNARLGPGDSITDLQFSHLTLLLSVFRYSLSFIFFNYYSSAARISYRLAFISAAVTYGIVVYKGHFARGVSGSVPQIVTKLISDENVQYLGECFMNSVMRQCGSLRTCGEHVSSYTNHT
jgi:hypothetical protein